MKPDSIHVFLTDFPQKLIISLERICLIVTKKLLRYLQNSRRSERTNSDTFLMIHRYTDTQTHTHTQTQGLPIYMEDFILPCNNCILAQLTVCVYVFSNNTDTEPAVAERLPGEQAPAVVGQPGEGVDDLPHCSADILVGWLP